MKLIAKVRILIRSNWVWISRIFNSFKDF